MTEEQVKMDQKERMNRESWNYLNQNGDDFAKIIVHQGERNGLGFYKSVSEVKKELGKFSN